MPFTTPKTDSDEDTNEWMRGLVQLTSAFRAARTKPDPFAAAIVAIAVRSAVECEVDRDNDVADHVSLVVAVVSAVLAGGPLTKEAEAACDMLSIEPDDLKPLRKFARAPQKEA